MRLVYWTLFWCFGIVVAASYAFISDSIWLVAAVLLILTAFLGRSFSRLQVALWLSVAFAFGGLRMAAMPDTAPIAQYNGTTLTISGVAIDIPDIRDDRVQFRLQTETVLRNDEVIPTSGYVLVQAPPFTNVSYGDHIDATGMLITPAEFDTFSYADYLARRGVYSIMPNAAVAIVGKTPPSPLLRAIFELRTRAKAAISHALPEPQAALLTGILLGDEGGIAPQVRDAFNTTGAAHIIAISGFNMVIVSQLAIAFASHFMSRRAATVFGIIFIALYTLLVGANAAVVRAAIMSSLLAVAPLFKRRTYMPASLAFATLLMTLENPTVLWDISFQLSVFAALGIALYAEPLLKAFRHLFDLYIPPVGARMMVIGILEEGLIVSLAAQIFTLPLVILYFGRLSPYLLLVNVLVTPVQSLLLIGGGLAVIVAFFSAPLALPLFWFALVWLSWTISVVRFFAQLPTASLTITVDPRWVALYFCVLIGIAMANATEPRWLDSFWRWLSRRLTPATLGVGILVPLVLTIGMLNAQPDGKLHVWFLNVGHSNGVLIQSPGGAHILVDGGRFPSRLLTALGDRLPFYDHTIELLAITHPDRWDIGALNAVASRYQIGAVLYHGQPNQTPEFLALQNALVYSDWVEARQGYTVRMDDGLLIEVLYPVQPPLITDSLNDNALVLRLQYGTVSFLLTSDLSADGQLALLDSSAWPTATVLQLPAHATRGSLAPEFLAAVQPSAYAVQIDPANRRGDPDGDVLNLLDDAIPLYRTDERGVLHFWTDGAELWFLPEAK